MYPHLVLMLAYQGGHGALWAHSSQARKLGVTYRYRSNCSDINMLCHYSESSLETLSTIAFSCHERSHHLAEQDISTWVLLILFL